MFIDTHAHLLFPDFNSDLDEVLERAQAAHVRYIINISINPEDSLKAIELVDKYDFLFTSVGIHPNELSELSVSRLNQIKEMTSHPKVIAIGEVGLDFYRKRSSPELQREMFFRFLGLSEETGLPLIFHVRDAWEEAEKIILEKNGAINGVFHCFSGNLSNGLNLIKNGCFLSYTGNITYKNFRKDEILKKIPLEHVMIETDCPFLTPEPLRGKRNEPVNVVGVAEKLAGLFDLSVEDIGRITSYNAFKLFGIARELNEPRIAYKIRDSLYINGTNKCSCNCVFCDRNKKAVLKGYNLKLKSDPTVEETIKSINKYTGYKEIVFCGYGEPTIRIDYLKNVAQWIKKNKDVKIRLNTNGHGSLINGRNIVPELKGLIDSVSVSLNAENAEKYLKLTRSTYNGKSYDALIEFMKDCKKNGIYVTATAVDYDGVNKEACKSIAEELGVGFRVREYKQRL